MDMEKQQIEHKMAMEAIGMISNILEVYRNQFKILVKAENDMHNFGGIFDPTLYRNMLYSKNFKLQMQMVKAAVAFLDEIDKVKKELDCVGN